MDKLDKPAADAIDWTAPRLVCIAAGFTKYDGHAVQQMNPNIAAHRCGKRLVVNRQREGRRRPPWMVCRYGPCRRHLPPTGTDGSIRDVVETGAKTVL
ncbi:hypothetical protein [Aquabacterium sp. J223]|uniref:hypothetical protein n=1 Tax=Aquabacterium sp. J223 TaxID=2898431 RepID=UPI0021AE0758|nr:hypothetical protein [Aquabacterium sp. J223]UUX96133.1 hypothetical protein LRS07_02015 [Aquabacterium sp. J223]